MKSLAAALAIPLLLPAAAAAGPCDALADQAATVTGQGLVSAYTELAACDTAMADGSFVAFFRAAGEVDIAVGLSLVAIDHQLYTPVWRSLDDIRDYSQRAEIAKGVGASCGAHPQVVQFLQGAYYGLRDLQFLAWDDALVTCADADLMVWLQSVVASPPSTTYDEKYNAVTDAYVHHKRGEALPVLQRAAIHASKNGGPFNALIEKMDQAVQPREFGAQMSDEDRTRLEHALVAVANEVGPELAAMVADRLFNSGAEEAAASLLPRVYPDRVQDDGTLLYGAASVETCGQETILHYTQVSEPSKRWSILGDVEEPLQAFKARLGCDAKRPWPVVATAEPIASSSDVAQWAERTAKQYEDQGNVVRLREEKPVALP